MTPSADYPFVHVVGLVSQLHCELVPHAIQELTRRRWPDGSSLEEHRTRLLERVRFWRTDAELRAWMHNSASLRTWAALHHALWQLSGYLVSATAEDRQARDLTAELVACPTLSNVVRLALRQPATDDG